LEEKQKYLDGLIEQRKDVSSEIGPDTQIEFQVLQKALLKEFYVQQRALQKSKNTYSYSVKPRVDYNTPDNRFDS